MDYVTHNQEQIPSDGSCLQGETTATFRELCDLFGAPGEGDGYKVDARWVIRFGDGTVATIYNWKDGVNYCGEDGTPVVNITDWHIGGFNRKALDLVQIVIDLHREAKQSEPEDEVEATFKSAFDMMDTIRANKGQGYARTVEIAMLVRKQTKLFEGILAGLVVNDHLSEKGAKGAMHIYATICAKIIALAADNANIITTNKKEAEELMNWADQMMKVEEQAAKELLKREGEDL